jgi:hypothetical protein
MTMKRIIFALATILVVFVALFVLAVVHPVRRVRAHQGCTQATLDGTYGVVASGWYFDLLTPFPANFSMLVNFNGSGQFTGNDLYIITYESSPTPGLQLVPGSPFMNVTGTYTVNSDCSIDFTIPNPPATPNPWDAVIYGFGVSVDTSGDEIMGNIYSSAKNTTATFDAKRVSIGKWKFFE